MTSNRRSIIKRPRQETEGILSRIGGVVLGLLFALARGWGGQKMLGHYRSRVIVRRERPKAEVLLTRRDMLRGRREWSAQLALTGATFYARQRDVELYYRAVVTLQDRTSITWGWTSGYPYKYAQPIQQTPPFSITLETASSQERSAWLGAIALVKVRVGDREGTLYKGRITEVKLKIED